MVEKMVKKSLVAEYRHEPDGWWLVTVRGLIGCRTQGRNLNQAKKRSRAAVEACLENGDSFINYQIEDKIVMPDRTSKALGAFKKLKRQLHDLQMNFEKQRCVLAKDFKNQGLSTADAGVLLELSKSRIDQILHNKR